MELEGAVAVVTGAADGIGRATALALGREGADVVAADLDIEGARAVASEIEAAGRRALALEVDVTQRAEVEELVRRAISWQGRCDLFMSNVGVGCAGAPHGFGPDEWAYMLDANLLSAVWPLRLVVPHMLERGSGCLVFVSSGAGYEGIADRAPYNVAKFGVVGLAEACARAYLGTGIQVTLVVPGAVATGGWKRIVVPGRDRAEVERVREEHRGHTVGWPSPGSMADAIVGGIREGRFCVVQHNPYDPGWFEGLLTRKGRDPDGFVRDG